MISTTKFRKLILFTSFLFAFGSGVIHARGREGFSVKPVLTDSGDIIETSAVTVGTNTPVQIFYSTTTQSRNYREIMFQNVSTNTFRVYIGTHSAMSSSSGGRLFIPAGGSWTLNARDDLWALFEAAAFGTGTLEVLGEYERDSLDASITNR